MNNKRLKILSIIAIVTMIIAIISLAGLGVKKYQEPKLRESDVKVIQEFKELSDIKDKAIRNEIAELVKSKVNDCYNINNRYFAVLSTGESQEGLVYQTRTNHTTGKLELQYRFTDDKNPDTEFKVRYRVIEFNGPVVVKETQLDQTNRTKNGIIETIIYGDRQNLIEYYPNRGNREISQSGYSEGIYTAIYENGKVVSYKKLNIIRLKDCKVLEKLLDNTYNVDIGNGNIVNIALNDINIEYGTRCLIDLSYTNRFNGEVISKELDV